MKKRNITIGIPGWKNYSSDPNTTMYGAGINHLEYISSWGNPRLIMPWETFAPIDVLYLPGGMDLNPRTYKEVPSFTTTNSDVFKQFFFDERLANYVGKVPIFGVCLGIQMLNVFFGGKLVQNLKFHKQSSLRWDEAHDIRMTTGRSSGKKVKVNSHHHQGILLSTLSSDFDAVGLAKNEEGYDEIVEAVLHKTLPIAGVQWHPEELYDEYSEYLFEVILNRL